MIYIVTGEWTDWEDNDLWLVHGFHDKSEAYSFCATLNEQSTLVSREFAEVEREWFNSTQPSKDQIFYEKIEELGAMVEDDKFDMSVITDYHLSIIYKVVELEVS